VKPAGHISGEKHCAHGAALPRSSSVVATAGARYSLAQPLGRRAPAGAGSIIFIALRRSAIAKPAKTCSSLKTWGYHSAECPPGRMTMVVFPAAIASRISSQVSRSRKTLSGVCTGAHSVRRNRLPLPRATPGWQIVGEHMQCHFAGDWRWPLQAGVLMFATAM
jgi:hypothetical protein